MPDGLEPAAFRAPGHDYADPVETGHPAPREEVNREVLKSGNITIYARMLDVQPTATIKLIPDPSCPNAFTVRPNISPFEAGGLSGGLGGPGFTSVCHAGGCTRPGAYEITGRTGLGSPGGDAGQVSIIALGTDKSGDYASYIDVSGGTPPNRRMYYAPVTPGTPAPDWP